MNPAVTVKCPPVHSAVQSKRLPYALWGRVAETGGPLPSQRKALATRGRRHGGLIAGGARTMSEARGDQESVAWFQIRGPFLNFWYSNLGLLQKYVVRAACPCNQGSILGWTYLIGPGGFLVMGAACPCCMLSIIKLKP